MHSDDETIWLTQDRIAELFGVQRPAITKHLKNSLAPGGVKLTYSFDGNIHDRFIETDAGWRINLGRGLDIFQKPQGRFTLGAIDQTKRRCKNTTITYVKR